MKNLNLKGNPKRGLTGAILGFFSDKLNKYYYLQLDYYLDSV